MGQHTLRFCDPEDLLRMYPKLDQVWPRADKTGKPINDWNKLIDLSMDELERELRARKGTSEPIELGRLGLRTKQRMKDVVALLAIHHAFVFADVNGDDSGWFVAKANYFRTRYINALDDEIQMLDYDADNSGTIDDFEKNQPMPSRFVRG